MYRLSILFSLLIIFLPLGCGKPDNLDLADDEFLLVATGEQVKCANYLYTFRSGDHSRIKAFLSPEPANGAAIGLINLDTAYQADDQIIVKLRKLTADEVQSCTADVPWYTKSWVLEHRKLK
ncbi:hypothetical protein [Sphingobacterium griseoflavum]|uniref:Lipoprotein n=1 Tax=Sphingobacterium griseoflavum TaxID=1474952 RepID=A0ABQ3HRN5_9SPHI|nr:hypothetical protein [Sphingobacterium griseoflavum]GHE23784.1 hypothetical protein GCM10017764_07520 [Sphingobacterium griseoflavum]